MEDPEPFRFSFEKVEETKEEDDDVTALIVLSGSSSTFLLFLLRQKWVWLRVALVTMIGQM